MPPHEQRHIHMSSRGISSANGIPAADNDYSSSCSTTQDANVVEVDSSKLRMIAMEAVAAEHASLGLSPKRTPSALKAIGLVGIVATKKRTRFALGSNEIFHIPHINDMSDEEVLGVWYEKTDYESIKQSIIPIVKRMMKGETVEETDQMTIRGLEYRTRKGAIRRQHNKVEAITAVLDEQDRQVEVNLDDPELISQVYLECSAHCLREAQVLAAGDIQAAIDYLNSPPLPLGVGVACSSPTSPVNSADEDGKRGQDRKHSINKMFQKMGIRRRPTLGGDDNSVASSTSSNTHGTHGTHGSSVSSSPSTRRSAVQAAY